MAAAIGLVLLLTQVTLHPPTGDLTVLAMFLAVSGGTTVVVGLGFRKFRTPLWLRSLRTRLILVSVLTTALALINVGFIAFLMFISTPDLALLAGLLAFSLAVSAYASPQRSLSQRCAPSEGWWGPLPRSAQAISRPGFRWKPKMRSENWRFR